LSKSDGLIVGIVNIICPGAGALVAAAMTGMPGDLILLGILQFLLAFILIGWVWAVIWGVRVIAASKDSDVTVSGAQPAAAVHAADVKDSTTHTTTGPTAPQPVAQAAPPAQPPAQFQPAGQGPPPSMPPPQPNQPAYNPMYGQGQ
jgi:hypothetical protein